MPDIFVVDRSGRVVQRIMDRADAWRPVYAVGSQYPYAYVYRRDSHDVVAPERINPVARAARARRAAYFASLRNCIRCGIDQEGHELFGEWGLGDPDACDEFTAPAPLVLV